MLLYYHLLVISMIRIGERQKKVDFYLKKKKKPQCSHGSYYCPCHKRKQT